MKIAGISQVGVQIDPARRKDQAACVSIRSVDVKLDDSRG
jgi:hypothetical protein